MYRSRKASAGLNGCFGFRPASKKRVLECIHGIVRRRVPFGLKTRDSLFLRPVRRSCGTIGQPHCSVWRRGCYVRVETDGGAASVPRLKSAVSELSRLGLGVFRSAAQPPCIGRVGFPSVKGSSRVVPHLCGPVGDPHRQGRRIRVSARIEIAPGGFDGGCAARLPGTTIAKP